MSMVHLKSFLVIIICLDIARAQSDTDCSPISSGYGNSDSCLLQDLQDKKLRVLYIDKLYTTMNQPARDAAAARGVAYTCDKPRQAQKECFVAENWQNGWVGQFMYNVFKDMGLDQSIVAMTVANFSSATSPENATSVYKGASASTRCVWEIALGNVDLCVGDFWETKERRNITHFTTSLSLDRFMLVTLAENVVDTSYMFIFPSTIEALSMYNIFLPFTTTVWMVNVAMVILGGVSLWFIESTDPFLAGDDKLDCNTQTFLECVYKSLKSYWIPQQFSAPANWAGKVVLAGLSVHFFIIMAFYTASLASFLATQDTVGGVISDFASLRSKYENPDWMDKICMLQSAQGLIDINPAQVVGMDNYGPMFEQLYNKKCAAVVTGRNEYLTYIQGENAIFSVCANTSDPKGYATCQDGGPSRTVNLYQCACKDTTLAPTECPDDCPDYLKYCNVIPVAKQDRFQAALNWALPVAEEYAEVVSTAILRQRLSGTLIKARQDQLVDKTPMRCAAAAASVGSALSRRQIVQDSSTAVNPQLTVSGFVGLYIYSAIIMAAGVTLHIWQTTRAVVSKRYSSDSWDVDAATAARADGDGKLAAGGHPPHDPPHDHPHDCHHGGHPYDHHDYPHDHPHHHSHWHDHKHPQKAHFYHAARQAEQRHAEEAAAAVGRLDYLRYMMSDTERELDEALSRRARHHAPPPLPPRPGQEEEHLLQLTPSPPPGPAAGSGVRGGGCAAGGPNGTTYIPHRAMGDLNGNVVGHSGDSYGDGDGGRHKFSAANGSSYAGPDIALFEAATAPADAAPATAEAPSAPMATFAAVEAVRVLRPMTPPPSDCSELDESPPPPPPPRPPSTREHVSGFIGFCNPGGRT